MFLKQLIIQDSNSIIRDITFHKGINLIVDETKTTDKKESGNNVGKTTVLRLIDFCLGGNGKNIYQDPEFKRKNNTQVKNFLQENNVVITLILTNDLEDIYSPEIKIRRNFLTYKKAIREINDRQIPSNEYQSVLKQLIFNSYAEKPTFRQIISKNIRDEKNRLVNTVKVLHTSTKLEEYEALYLFWLGIELDEADRKQKLLTKVALEQKILGRLEEYGNLSQVKQSLIVIKRNIEALESKKDSFGLNEDHSRELATLNQIKAQINISSSQLSRLVMRKLLILESKHELELDTVTIDTENIRQLYSDAKSLVPDIQRSYEDTVRFHNEMVQEKIRYITKELPALDVELQTVKQNIDDLVDIEKNATVKLTKIGAIEALQEVVSELNKLYEQKGNFEERALLWNKSEKAIEETNSELEQINKEIASKDDLIQERIAKFNEYFSQISSALYDKPFILISDKRNKKNCYTLETRGIDSANMGTGKKKGEIAAFDLAYIQFADELSIDCLHFILQDQIENVHEHQITSLFTDIVSLINCQYILPVLRDKLPVGIDLQQYQVLSLSQQEKLFKI